MIGGTEANFWRITVATGLLAIYGFGLGAGLTGAGLPFFLMSGILGIGLGDVAYFQSLPRLGPRLTLLLVQCLTAPIGALIEWIWLGTTLTLAQLLCALTILAGVGIALAPEEHVKITRRDLVIGSMAGLLAALGWATTTVLIRASRLATISATKVLFYQLAASTALLLPLSPLLGESGVTALNVPIVLALAYQGVIVAFASYLTWFWLLTRHLAGRLMVFSFLTPLFGVAFGVLFLGERLTPSFIVAAVCVTLGIVLVNLPASRQAAAESPE